MEYAVGEIERMPVLDIVHGSSHDYFLVKCLGRKCRVPMFDWQKSKRRPNSIRCRIVSINEFGFPTIEQVADTDEINIIEPVNKTVKDNVKKKPRTIQQSFVPATKEEKTIIQQPDEVVVSDEVASTYTEKDFQYYRWANQSDSFEDWFISTGGLKARLQILVDLARQLAEYHRHNKVYKELVPDFIKICKTKNGALKVVLPETCNLSSGFNDIFIYASCAAPEIVNRRMPNTPMSDCYTFAIIAFELLEFCHPFLGDDAIKHNRHEDAFRGRLAWIDNPDDDTNRHIHRYYDRSFTSTDLWNLFQETFTFGMYDVISRPSIFKWIDALEDELNHLRYCPKCKTDFLCYDFEDDECPFCDNENEFNIVADVIHISQKFDVAKHSFIDNDCNLSNDIVDSFYISETNPAVLTSNDLLSTSRQAGDVLSIRVKSINERAVSILVEPLNSNTFYVSSPELQKYNQKIERATAISFPKQSDRSLVFSLDDVTMPQRAIRIKAIQ